jgi:hypothetical protein
MMTPATGSKLYSEAFTSGLAYASVAGRRVESYMLDANYVVASRHPHPWRKQFNIMLAYAYFYNPLRFLWALVRPKSKLYLADALMQCVGMSGLLQTIQHTFGWMVRLWCGDVQRHSHAPGSPIPMHDVQGGQAAHTLVGAPSKRPTSAVPGRAAARATPAHEIAASEVAPSRDLATSAVTPPATVRTVTALPQLGVREERA